MITEQEILVTLVSNEDRSIDRRKGIENGLDFILSHFNQSKLFPRTIMTRKLGYQKEVFSKEEALSYFQQSNYVDCRINAFPSYTEYKGIQRYPPDLIFIDIDRNNFETGRSFKLALSTTLRNIREKLVDGFPTVLWTGGGYHIYQPVYCPTSLENIIEFNEFDRPSEQFLRFAKDYFSNGKADKNNNPSFKSCLLRIPGSINSKNNAQVKIIQTWNGIRPDITRELLEDFRTYLIQKRIDEYNYRKKILSARKKYDNIYNPDVDYYEWIEQILKTPFEDCRKIILRLILAPYLINVKQLSYQESYNIIKNWLDKCNDLEKLDDYRNFSYRIHYALKNSATKGIGPMSLYKIKTDPKYSKLYVLLS